MSKRKCPACGILLDEGIEQCPKCGLEGLNLRFLNKAGYEKWVKEDLLPRRASKTIKVFAGARHGLILTGWGDLYGFGDNRFSQIADNGPNHYEQPVLMARDVISVAAGCNCTAYVNRVGELHWQGDKTDAFPKCSGVQSVYMEFPAESDGEYLYSAHVWKNRIWVVLENGEIFCFGDNEDGQLADRRRVMRYQLPAVEGMIADSDSMIFWLDDGSITASAEQKFENIKEYVELVQQYGEENVILEVVEHELDLMRRALNTVFAKSVKKYYPMIDTVNNVIFDPIPFNKEFAKGIPHRVCSRPLLKEEYDRYGWKDIPGAKVISSSNKPEVSILEDGTIWYCGGGQLEWISNPVADIAFGTGMFVLACRNGDILWCSTEAELWTGNVKRLHL